MKVNSNVGVKVGMECKFIPRDGLGMDEAKDKCLEAGNSLLDYGDDVDRVLLIAKEEWVRIGYEFIPEACSKGATVQDLARFLIKEGKRVTEIKDNMVICHERIA